MSLEDAIHKVTGLPAQRFHLEREGLLRPGYHANITVFSDTEIGTQSNYEVPDCAPQGIEHVLVNGSWGVRQGQLQELFSGRPVRT